MQVSSGLLGSEEQREGWKLKGPGRIHAHYSPAPRLSSKGQEVSGVLGTQPHSPDLYAHQHTGWQPLNHLVGLMAMLVKQGQASDSTSLLSPLPCSTIFSFLSRWLQKFPEDFCEAPDMAIVRQFMDYVRLNVPSVDVDTQATELLLALEEQEAKELKLEKGEETWGGLPGKVGGGFSDGFHQGILQSSGLNPGLDSSQVICPTVRRGLGILWHEKALCDHQGHLEKVTPYLAASTKSPSPSALRLCSISRALSARCLEDARDSGSEASFCGRATGRPATPRGH